MTYLLADAQSHLAIAEETTLQEISPQTRRIAWNVFMVRAGIIAKSLPSRSDQLLVGELTHKGEDAIPIGRMQEIMSSTISNTIKSGEYDRHYYNWAIDRAGTQPALSDEERSQAIDNIFLSKTYKEVRQFKAYTGKDERERQKLRSKAMDRSLRVLNEIAQSLASFDPITTRPEVTAMLAQRLSGINREDSVISMLFDPKLVLRHLEKDNQRLLEYTGAMSILFNYGIFKLQPRAAGTQPSPGFLGPASNSTSIIYTYTQGTAEQHPTEIKVADHITNSADALVQSKSRFDHTVIISTSYFNPLYRLELESYIHHVANSNERNLSYRIVRTPDFMTILFFKPNDQRLRTHGGEAYIRRELKTHVEEGKSIVGRDKTSVPDISQITDVIEYNLEVPKTAEKEKAEFRQRIASGLNAIDERGFAIRVNSSRLNSLGINQIGIRLDSNPDIHNFVVDLNILGRRTTAVIDREGKLFVEPGFTFPAYQALEYYILNYVAEVRDGSAHTMEKRNASATNKNNSTKATRHQNISQLRVLPSGHISHGINNFEIEEQVRRYYGDTSLVELNAHFLRAQSEPAYLDTIESTSLKGRIEKMLNAIDRKSDSSMSEIGIRIQRSGFNIRDVLESTSADEKVKTQKQRLNRTLNAVLAECRRLDPAFDISGFLKNLNFLPFFTTFVAPNSGESLGEPREVMYPEADIRVNSIK